MRLSRSEIQTFLKNHKTVVSVIAPFFMAIAAWCAHPRIAIDMDSGLYLMASPMRTATYPLFLKVAYGPALLPIQLFLFSVSLSWLVISSSRFLPWCLVTATMLAIAANPYLWQLQGTIMSEALTTPLETIIVSCVLGFSATSRRPLLALAALVAGLATTARPSLLPLVLAPICLAWITPNLRGRATLTALVIIAWAAPIAVERMYSHAVHGRELTSPVARNLFMKAAVIDAPTTKPRSDSQIDSMLMRELNEEYEPVRRLIKRAPSRDVRLILLTNYEGCAGYGCFTANWRQLHVDDAELDRHIMKASVDRLMSNPMGYLQLTASDYLRMWLLHQRKLPDIAPKYNAFLAHDGPIPFQDRLGKEGQPTPLAEQKPILRLNRIVFASVGIVAALMTIALIFWRRGQLNQAALALLLASQAVLVLSAFLGSGLVRYAMGVWPTLIASEVIGTAALLAQFNQKSRPAWPRTAWG